MSLITGKMFTKPLLLSLVFCSAHLSLCHGEDGGLSRIRDQDVEAILAGISSRQEAITECGPVGTDVVIESQEAKCPCLAKYEVSAASAQPSERFDFLIMSKSDFQRYNASGFKSAPYVDPRYSRFDLAATTTPEGSSSIKNVTGPFEIPSAGDLTLVIRSTRSSKNCSSTPKFLFDPIPGACPVILTSRSVVEVSPRIVGGVPASNSDTISGSVFYKNNRGGGCTGSLIDPSFVLTAAHCTFEREVTEARVGGTNDKDGKIYSVKKVHTFSGYKPFNGLNISQNDIALLELSKPASGANLFTINRAKGSPVEGEFLRVSGYGKVNFGAPSLEDRTLKRVDLPVVSTSDCRANFAKLAGQTNSTFDKDKFSAWSKQIDDGVICAGYVKGGCDSCQGDR